MGFDNECILNIQSLAGEYFCPVCRTLVYPHEAVQTQCTHLYCKPCLTYVVSSTQACPYDGYLVTEAGSKPLMESNKALAETIGKTTVHCLYHRSGCVWQGPLSDCTTHCSGCSFGNSPVVCNRCGIQIVHRQVQEHAQTCNVNGTTTQPQGTETAQDVAAPGVTVPTDHSKIANQAATPASQPATATGPTTAQNVNQPATANPVPQAMSVAPTPEQWYQQQYQQYYQQYPGYDPYQQTYQQYFPYQQQPAQQFPQPPAQLQGQAQNPAQSQSQPFQPQAQIPMQAQQQVQGQAPPQVPSNGQPQPLYSQPQIQAQNQPYPQVQPQPGQSHTQPIMQVPQYPQQHPQPPQPPNFQPLSQPPPQSQPFNPQQPPVQSAGGPPTYPSQPHQQIQHAQPQQHPMQVQPSTGSMPPGQMPTQFPPPPPHMRPAQPHMLPPQGQAPGIPPTQPIQPGLPPHQRPVMHQAQQQMPQPHMQQPQAYPGQASGPFAQQHPQFPPLGPPQPMQQPPFGFAQPPPHGMPPQSSQSYAGRPAMPNHGGQQQQFPQSSGPADLSTNFPYHQQQQLDNFPQPPAQFQGRHKNPAHISNPQNPFQPQAQIPMQAQQQVQGQAPPQVPSNGQPQPLYSQPQIQAQNQPYPQVQPQPGPSHTQPIMQVPQYPQQHPQPPQPPNFQLLSQPPPQSQPFNPQQPPVQSAGGPPTYPSQPHQQIQHAQPQQHPMQVQPSTGSMPPVKCHTVPPTNHHTYASSSTHMLPLKAKLRNPTTQKTPIQTGLPPHQRPVMHQAQQQMPQPHMQQPQAYPGQASGPFAQQHPQFPPLGPPQPMQQPPFGFAQPPPHGMPPQSSQSYAGRPAMPNHGGQQQQFPQSSGPAGIAPQARPPQYGPSQPFVNQYAPPPLGGVERRVEQQEDKSSSVKKSESMGTSDFGANVSEVKSEAGLNDERRPGNGVEEDHRKGEALQGSQGDSVTIQRVKEESKDGAFDHSPGGKSSQNRTDERGVATTDSVKHGEAGVNFNGSSENDNGSLASQGSLNGRDRMQHGTEQSPHPPVPYAASGQQGPGQPPSHFRPPEHGYLAHGPHSGEYLQPPGSFHPEHFGNNNRGYEPHTRFSRMSQGEPLGPPLNSAPPPHGPPDGQSVPRHPGPMEPDMFQNQRPPYFDGRRADSHLPGDIDMGPYGQPFGVDTHSMRMK
ncbi:mediator of RNA polymerase II transcription subunit 12 [Tanacetum coccineum]|uniref:Mediator of RNA polymerase II transcription subunit 12 n=1 Tax=Tanacetum coccineum TaxID=301880 RepID=A0ABQ5G7Z7_9ASTR